MKKQKFLLVWIFIVMMQSPLVMAKHQISKMKWHWQHSEDVNTVAFSPNSHLLATGSYKIVKLWSVQSGQLQYNLIGHKDWVWSVAFSPNGKWLASASRDNTVKLWRVKSGRLQRTLKHQNEVWSIAFSPSGKWLASASRDNTVKLWETVSGRLRRTLVGHKNSVLSVAFSPSGKWLASGSQDNTIKLWNMVTGQLQQTLRGHTDLIWSVAFSPDSAWLASGGADKIVRLWEMASKNLRYTLDHHNEVTSLAFSANSKWLASGNYKNVKLWNVASWHLHKLTGHKQHVLSVAFSPNNKWLASASFDNTVNLWTLNLKKSSKSSKSSKVFNSLTSKSIARNQKITSNSINSISLDFICELPLSPKFVKKARPLEKVVIKYNTQQNACWSQLNHLHKTQQQLTELQEQIYTAKRNISNNKNSLDKRKKQLKLAEQLEKIDDSFLAKTQRKNYQKSLHAFKNSQLHLENIQQKIISTETKIIQEQNTLKHLAEKVDYLRQELAEARFQRFKRELEQEKVIEVRAEINCSDDMTIKTCKEKAKQVAKQKASKQGAIMLVKAAHLAEFNSKGDVAPMLIKEEEIFSEVNDLLLQHEILDEGFGKQGTYFYKIRATVKGQAPSMLRKWFLGE
ncbi:hypothetical protein [Candidatus Parabeggiatoa sp. HSG14]|uniref:WD40 domain-containing protein n=1 Tax=Candidatus Parabeggiatoa sp. HSG14 TaxID=3055593 RepID=UPI0025A8505B|nr:hypothetical protein [Thiotrichales bacterium HSG14]